VYDVCNTVAEAKQCPQGLIYTHRVKTISECRQLLVRGRWVSIARRVFSSGWPLDEWCFWSASWMATAAACTVHVRQNAWAVPLTTAYWRLLEDNCRASRRRAPLIHLCPSSTSVLNDRTRPDHRRAYCMLKEVNRLIFDLPAFGELARGEATWSNCLSR